MPTFANVIRAHRCAVESTMRLHEQASNTLAQAVWFLLVPSFFVLSYRSLLPSSFTLTTWASISANEALCGVFVPCAHKAKVTDARSTRRPVASASPPRFGFRESGGRTISYVPALSLSRNLRKDEFLWLGRASSLPLARRPATQMIRHLYVPDPRPRLQVLNPIPLNFLTLRPTPSAW